MNDLCSMELLRNVVARRLAPAEEATLHAHLEHCEACCAQIEKLAGGEAWQQETAALLSADEFDAEVPKPAIWSEADFSVEHLDPSDDANVLGQIGGYDVLTIVGRGGMGVVLKAFDRELKRLVAIKTLAPHLAHSSVARKRFAREAQAAAAVVNPHVIAIHSVQPTGRLPFLIMPLLTGESLAQRLKARGPLELTEVLRIGMQTAAGLAAAHDQGLVHRDVKPANIFLENGVERVVITDFGLARAADDVSMTRQGVVAGTPEYMSPEQARGEALDSRSDLFSLGCVLYEMATGVSPFRTDSTMATLRRIVDEQPPAMASLVPELPPWLSYIVEQLLSKHPAQRFASASEVSQLLEQCLSHLQQPMAVALPSSLSRPSFVAASRRQKTFSIGVLIMIVSMALGLVAMFAWQGGSSPDVAHESLEGVWEVVLPPDIAANRPEDQRLRLVIAGDWQGTFRGDQRVSASRLKVEPQYTPQRLSFIGVEGKPMRGIYEVKEDGLRLSVAPDTNALPTKFGTKHPEFKRVEGKLAEEQVVALIQYSKTAATTGTSAPSNPTGDKTTFDKSALPKVSKNLQPQTTVLNGLVNGGGIIERIEANIVHFKSGDRIAVPAGTMLLLPKHGERPITMHKSDLLEPGMAIAYSIRDGKIEKLVLIGIVEKAQDGKSVFDTINDLQLRKGNESTTSIDGRFPIRITGSDGEVAVKIGETKLIKLPKPTKLIEWRAGDFKPEGIDDIEPFDYVLVEWRAKGRLTFTCYASPR